MPTPESAPKAGGMLQTLRTVAWGLLGVRGHKPDEDAPALSPLRILLTALGFMLVFVLVLVTVAIKATGR